MIPEVNKYYLTVPVKFREKLNDWNIQEKYYIEDGVGKTEEAIHMVHKRK